MSALLRSDIREHWERIRPWLQEIAAENRAAWIPEDLYATVMAGRATLFMAEDLAGLVIVQRSQECYSEEKLLYIMACYHPAGDAQDRFGAAIDAIAASVGCDVIEFDTLRTGFDRRGGWVRDRVVYRRRIAHG